MTTTKEIHCTGTQSIQLIIISCVLEKKLKSKLLKQELAQGWTKTGFCMPEKYFFKKFNNQTKTQTKFEAPKLVLLGCEGGRQVYRLMTRQN